MENTVENMMDQQNQNLNYASGDDGYEAEVVTLAENGSVVSVTEQGAQDSGAPDAQNPTGAAAQANHGYQNQQQVNRAFAARLQAERQKYKGDIELSGKLRSLFSGMSDEEIVNKLQNFAANDYATTKNIPVPVAEEVMGIRMQNRQPVMQQPENPVTPEVQKVVDDAREIEDRYGVNIAKMIVESPELQQRVFVQGVSLNDILIEHLQSQQPTRKAHTPAMSPNGSRNVQAPMTDEEYNRIKEQLRQGKKVRR